MAVNAISPIDPFDYDVAPNQYYRVVFLDASDLYVLDSYWSINLTLPVYFVLITNVFFGVLISIIFIAFIYKLWIKYSSNFYVFILIIISLYDIVYFFDWVMVVQNMFSVFLTIFALKKYKNYGKGEIYLHFKHRLYRSAIELCFSALIGSFVALIKFDFKLFIARLYAFIVRTYTLLMLILRISK